MSPSHASCFRVLWSFVLLVASAGCFAGGQDEGGAEVSLAPAIRHASLYTLQFRAAALTWIDDTSVAVLDRDEQQIVVLGTPGGSQRRGASKGAGPGELSGAMMLLANPDGELLVGDMQQNRVSHFNADLSYVRSARVRGMPIQLISWDGDRVTGIWMQFGMGVEPKVGEIDLASGEERELFSLYESEMGLNRPESDNPFAPAFISAVSTDSELILVGHSKEYRIVALDRTESVHARLGRDDLPADALSAQERSAERSRMSQASAGRGPPPPGMERMLEDALEEPRPYFGPNAFSLDRAGRLWVITAREHGDSTEVDVFGRTGAFLGTVVLGDRVAVIKFRGTRMAALVERAAEGIEGLQGIDLYDLHDIEQ